MQPSMHHKTWTAQYTTQIMPNQHSHASKINKYIQPSLTWITKHGQPIKQSLECTTQHEETNMHTHHEQPCMHRQHQQMCKDSQACTTLHAKPRVHNPAWSDKHAHTGWTAMHVKTSSTVKYGQPSMHNDEPNCTYSMNSHACTDSTTTVEHE